MSVPIRVHSICILLLLQQKYSAFLQHRRNRCQPPLPTARCPSRANGGASVPAPMVALPFWRVLTSVSPTSVPPTPHTVHPSHPSHPASNQPAHKNQCFLIQQIRYDPIQPIKYDPVNDTILSIRQYNKIHPMIRYDPVSPLIRKTHSIPILSCLTASAYIFYTTFTYDPPSSDFSFSPAASVTRNLLSSSSDSSSADFFDSDLDSPTPKADFWPF